MWATATIKSGIAIILLLRRVSFSLTDFGGLRLCSLSLMTWARPRTVRKLSRSTCVAAQEFRPYCYRGTRVQYTVSRNGSMYD